MSEQIYADHTYYDLTNCSMPAYGKEDYDMEAHRGWAYFLELHNFELAIQLDVVSHLIENSCFFVKFELTFYLF